ncbi:MAG: arsenate reductase ArsC [Anaerovoracaceae bacterium]
MEKGKKKIGFICVHNSCRSQIAEGLCNKLAGDVFEAYSGGTETKPSINQDAVRILRELHGVDMEQNQYSKLIDTLPKLDIVITMGCNVSCPNLPCEFREDWGLEDPSGKSDVEFVKCINQIEQKIIEIKSRFEH